MRLKTILNKTEKYSSFVFKDSRFCDHYDEWTFGDEAIVVEVEPRSLALKTNPQILLGRLIINGELGISHVAMMAPKLTLANKDTIL